MRRIFRTPEHVTEADLLFGQIDDPHIRAQRQYMLACAVGRGFLIVLGFSLLSAGIWHLGPDLVRAIPAMIAEATNG